MPWSIAATTQVYVLLAVGAVAALLLGLAVGRLLDCIVSAIERSKRLPAFAVIVVFAPALLIVAGCVHTVGADSEKCGPRDAVASWYHEDSLVATGAKFEPEGITAAHKTCPFGSRLRVTNKHNGRAVMVTVNDRGPYIAGRHIDLSRGAARVVGMLEAGVVPVEIEVLFQPSSENGRRARR